MPAHIFVISDVHAGREPSTSVRENGINPRKIEAIKRLAAFLDAMRIEHKGNIRLLLNGDIVDAYNRIAISFRQGPDGALLENEE